MGTVEGKIPRTLLGFSEEPRPQHFSSPCRDHRSAEAKLITPCVHHTPGPASVSSLHVTVTCSTLPLLGSCKFYPIRSRLRQTQHRLSIPSRSIQFTGDAGVHRVVAGCSGRRLDLGHVFKQSHQVLRQTGCREEERKQA